MSRAAQRGVATLALTDHDTVAGLARARRAGEECGVQLIDGIEFSSCWGRRGVHIVGLGVAPGSPALKAAVEYQQRARRERAEAIAARLSHLGMPGALEGARAQAGEGQVGRPHLARYLVEQGWARDVSAAFKKYLGQGKPADVGFQWPEMERVIGWIHAAGGVAVLAHPLKYALTRTKLRALATDFAELGGDAMELISGQQPAGRAEDLARIARELGLAASCGSDFHRPDAPWQELGNFGRLPSDCSPVWDLPALTQRASAG